MLQGARPADAAEVVQEVMTKVWRSWDTLRSPLAWARVTAGREWVKRVASLEEDLVREFPERSVLLSSDTDIDQWIKCNHYYRLVAALPPRQRQVMVWTQEGYEPSEIAELLRLKPATVRSNLRKARSAIARYIEEGEQR
ncbi:RNA polymerase sigma factor [Nocardia carnea]|uniref:RNA polymerase sigma factor n=1 Tax=Nocardia carnea TaxID=37328 RepID=UPI0024546413|nr:sigma-70 family RNA polymerase sigma factor [Nocardia carnea]